MFSHCMWGGAQGREGLWRAAAKIAVKDFFFSSLSPPFQAVRAITLIFGSPVSCDDKPIWPWRHHMYVSAFAVSALALARPPRPFLRPRKCHPQSCPKRTGMAVGADSLPIHLPSSARLHAPPEHDIECLIPAVVGRWWRLWVLLFFF